MRTSGLARAMRAMARPEPGTGGQTVPGGWPRWLVRRGPALVGVLDVVTVQRSSSVSWHTAAVVTREVDKSAPPDDADGLRVLVLGTTGSAPVLRPVPDEHPQIGLTAVNVVAEDDVRFLMEAGVGAGALAEHLGIIPDAIFVSHDHLDHYAGLPDLVLFLRERAQQTGQRFQIPTYGPAELRSAVDELLSDGGSDDVLEYHPITPGQTYPIKHLTVTFHKVDHALPMNAFGARVEGRTRTIGYSGDVGLADKDGHPSPGLVRIYDGADVVLADAGESKHGEKPGIHMSGASQARVAQEVPDPPTELIVGSTHWAGAPGAMVQESAGRFRGTVRGAQPGVWYQPGQDPRRANVPPLTVPVPTPRYPTPRGGVGDRDDTIQIACLGELADRPKLVDGFGFTGTSGYLVEAGGQRVVIGLGTVAEATLRHLGLQTPDEIDLLIVPSLKNIGGSVFHYQNHLFGRDPYGKGLPLPESRFNLAGPEGLHAKLTWMIETEGRYPDIFPVERAFNITEFSGTYERQLGPLKVTATPIDGTSYALRFTHGRDTLVYAPQLGDPERLRDVLGGDATWAVLGAQTVEDARRAGELAREAGTRNLILADRAARTDPTEQAAAARSAFVDVSVEDTPAIRVARQGESYGIDDAGALRSTADRAGPMHVREHPLVRRLLALGLSTDDFAIAGSGPLWANGMRGDIGDLDVIVRPRAWPKVVDLPGSTVGVGRYTGAPVVSHGPIEMSPGWWMKDADALIDQAQLVGGVRFVRMPDALEYKGQLYRRKDVADIEAAAGDPLVGESVRGWQATAGPRFADISAADITAAPPVDYTTLSGDSRVVIVAALDLSARLPTVEHLAAHVSELERAGITHIAVDAEPHGAINALNDRFPGTRLSGGASLAGVHLRGAGYRDEGSTHEAIRKLAEKFEIVPFGTEADLSSANPTRDLPDSIGNVIGHAEGSRVAIVTGYPTGAKFAADLSRMGIDATVVPVVGGSSDAWSPILDTARTAGRAEDEFAIHHPVGTMVHLRQASTVDAVGGDGEPIILDELDNILDRVISVTGRYWGADRHTLLADLSGPPTDVAKTLGVHRLARDAGVVVDPSSVKVFGASGVMAEVRPDATTVVRLPDLTEFEVRSDGTRTRAELPAGVRRGNRPTPEVEVHRDGDRTTIAWTDHPDLVDTSRNARDRLAAYGVTGIDARAEITISDVSVEARIPGGSTTQVDRRSGRVRVRRNDASPRFPNGEILADLRSDRTECTLPLDHGRVVVKRAGDGSTYVTNKAHGGPADPSALHVFLELTQFLKMHGPRAGQGARDPQEWADHLVWALQQQNRTGPDARAGTPDVNTLSRRGMSLDEARADVIAAAKAWGAPLLAERFGWTPQRARAEIQMWGTTAGEPAQGRSASQQTLEVADPERGVITLATSQTAGEQRRDLTVLEVAAHLVEAVTHIAQIAERPPSSDQATGDVVRAYELDAKRLVKDFLTAAPHVDDPVLNEVRSWDNPERPETVGATKWAVAVAYADHQSHVQEARAAIAKGRRPAMRNHGAALPARPTRDKNRQRPERSRGHGAR